MVTTLPQASWSAERVLELSGWRWHIEILFKRFKQVLDTHRFSCRCWQTAQALILALLSAWLLIEEEAEHLRQQIIAGEPEGLWLSCWQLTQLACHGLRHVVSGWGSPARLRELAPDLKRLLLEKRRRPRLESQRRLRAASLLSDASDLVSFFECSGASLDAHGGHPEPRQKAAPFALPLVAAPEQSGMTHILSLVGWGGITCFS